MSSSVTLSLHPNESLEATNGAVKESLNATAELAVAAVVPSSMRTAGRTVRGTVVIRAVVRRRTTGRTVVRRVVRVLRFLDVELVSIDLVVEFLDGEEVDGDDFENRFLEISQAGGQLSGVKGRESLSKESELLRDEIRNGSRLGLL